MTQTSSLDDILLNEITKTQAPKRELADEPAPDNDFAENDNDSSEIVSRETSSDTARDTTLEPETEYSAPEATVRESEVDDYGNEKPVPRTYTEDEVNERINSAVRERLARQERNGQQPTQQQVQQQTRQGFEYDSESADSWQQQLETFIENTVDKMSSKQAQRTQALREQQAQAEFESKFHQGMSKFADYVDVVKQQPITDAMVMATRSMKDPAAFIYAASKRAPQELQRIAQIQDHVIQIAEMAKLEERMKSSKPTTKVPKPLSRTQEDIAPEVKSNRQPSIEELIAMDAKKKLELQRQRKR